MSARDLAIVGLLCCPMLSAAGSPELKLPSFAHLEARAAEAVDISIGAWPLRIAAWVMDEKDKEEAHLKKLFAGLKSIHVRSYTFDSDFEYSQADIEAVRKQLHRGGWSQLVQARNRIERSTVDICILYDGDEAKGLAIVSAEPREFTIVNIVGSIDVDSLDELEGQFGIPKLHAVRSVGQVP